MQCKKENDMNSGFEFSYMEDLIVNILKQSDRKFLDIVRKNRFIEIFTDQVIIRIYRNGKLKVRFHVLAVPNFAVFLIETFKKELNIKEITLLDSFCYASRNTLEYETGTAAFDLSLKGIYDQVYEKQSREQLSLLWMASTENFEVKA